MCTDFVQREGSEVEMKIAMIGLAFSLMNAVCIPSIVAKHGEAFQLFLHYSCKVRMI